MKKFKALYNGMVDDLTDGEMMIDYAYCIREEGDKNLADEIARYAQERMEHFDKFHKLFHQEVGKHSEIAPETVNSCLWDEIHETIKHWHDKIMKRIEKY